MKNDSGRETWETPLGVEPAHRGDREQPRRLPPGRPMAMPRVPDSPRYAIADLEAETGFNARTIRYYITEGLLAPAHGRGPSAAYDKDHLLRLRFIQELKTAHLPLDEIREKVGELSIHDLEAHFAIASRPVEERWRRVRLHPDLELHVRARDDVDYRFERAVDQVMQHARFVFEQLGEDR